MGQGQLGILPPNFPLTFLFYMKRWFCANWSARWLRLSYVIFTKTSPTHVFQTSRGDEGILLVKIADVVKTLTSQSEGPVIKPEGHYCQNGHLNLGVHDRATYSLEVNLCLRRYIAAVAVNCVIEEVEVF